MNKIILKKRITYSIAASALLFVCFLLCRYHFLHLHGMEEWPVNLFVFGMSVIIVSAIFDSRKVMIFTSVGYIIGFAFGILFNADSFDAGGGRLNNAWIIWTVSFLILIVIGVVWEIIAKMRIRHRGKK